MTDACNCRREHQRRTGSPDDAKHNQEMPVLCSSGTSATVPERVSAGWLTSTDTQQHRLDHHEDAPGEDQQTWPLRIHDRADLDTEKEGQEQEAAKDPTYGPLAVILELMRAQMGLKDTHGIHDAEGSRHAAEGAKHNRPGPQASLWVARWIVSVAEG